MPHDVVSDRQRGNARAMRRAMTEAELKLWSELRAHRLMAMPFRRQVSIGPYIADFASPKYNLVVEVDGAQHGDGRTAARDCERTAYLERRGWTVLRFWNDDVLRDIDGVCMHIVAAAGLDRPEPVA